MVLTWAVLIDTVTIVLNDRILRTHNIRTYRNVEIYRCYDDDSMGPRPNSCGRTLAIAM